MNTLYELTEKLAHTIDYQYGNSAPSDYINRVVNEFIAANMETESGKLRYPQYYETALRQVASCARIILNSRCIIFGYWYEGEFYTTDKKSDGVKTTDELRGLLPCRFWGDILPSGMYYLKTLKPYFVESKNDA